MKTLVNMRILVACGILWAWGLFLVCAADTVETPLPALADTDGVLYAIGNWSESGLGNHRAVVQVKNAADAVFVRLPWRRQDSNPEIKGVVVDDAAGRQVTNVICGTIGRAAGELVFEPAAGPGDYFIYFMPNGKLAPAKATAAGAWLQRLGLDNADRFPAVAARLPVAMVQKFESRLDFHRRDPMELIATPAETADLLARHPQADYLVFPEDRRFCVRMFNDLPYRWIRRGPSNAFSGEASPNEYYTFQLGLYACRQAITDIRLQISDLHGPGGAVLPARAIRCINAGGVNWAGTPFSKPIVIGSGTVKPLWFVVDLPEHITAGTYRGTVSLAPEGHNAAAAPRPTTVALDITIGGAPVPYHGCLDAWRMSRLGWLDSTKGLEDTVIAPYLPVEWTDHTATILNRRVDFNDLGFPCQINAGGHDLLTDPVTFTVEGASGPVAFTPGAAVTVTAGKSLVTRKWTHDGATMQMQVEATVESDGCVEYRITLTANQDTTTKDITLDIPLRAEIAEYFMGLGQRGGLAPARVQWKWNVDRVTNKAWAGNADGGLLLDLMDNEDIWPAAYNYRNWGVPPSWDNQAQGGCDFTRADTGSRLHAYSGPRAWKAGAAVTFRFHLLVTPFKNLDMGQFQYRYANKHGLEAPEPLDGPARIGNTIGHLHQAMGGINPWINYPFLTMDAMKAYRTLLLAHGYKDVDVYYTMREMSNHITEMWALRSLDDEIFSANEAITYDANGGRVFKGGGGYSWLQEHLLTGYAPAWAQGVDGDVDAAIATQGLSRLHNFYVEGMDLLMQRIGFKGQYIDGLAYNRQITKRIARVMATNATDYRIKFHSGNNYDYAGWCCSPLLQYCEHLPYITDLWIGEGFSYNTPPDYWFVEMSGIPFGLTNEMLDYHGGGNQWRGMVYGMDSRQNPSAPGLWKLWDQFGIQQSRMIGYWDKHCPVQTGVKDILATAFVAKGRTLVAIGSWAAEPRLCQLTIDWKTLGLDPRQASLYAPEVQNFQSAALTAVNDAIPVMPGRGWLLVLDNEKHEAPPFQLPADAYKGRTLLLQDSFPRQALGDTWIPHVSGNTAASLKLDAGTIAITAPANCFAFVERVLPAHCGLVECKVFSGTDAGATWGPGMALLWKNNKAVRVNLRTKQCFGVDTGGNQSFVGKVLPDTWYHLRFRWEKYQLAAEASTDAKLWFPIATFPRHEFEGDPIAVRLGKMNGSSAPGDFSSVGAVGSSAITDFRVYGVSGRNNE